MKKASLELIVGLFVLVGILCLTYLSVKLGKIEFFSSAHYQLHADFASVSGLKNGAAVELAGVEVGKVERIMLDPKFHDQARVFLKINRDVPITDDVIASVRTKGIIGDKFIKLKPGGSKILLGDNGKIRETESSVDLEELLSKYIHGSVQ
jgi:phospholipid/cholesterol/gamma-HCH transport system substrate-binding protein